MKEFKQLAGVRKWHGDEFIALQTEVLEPLQALISDKGNCIISGCVVSNNGTNNIMSAGVFGCLHPDGYKIVKLAQTVLPTSTGANYLSVTKSTETKLYDDGNVKLSANIYTGTIGVVQPNAGYYIKLSSLNAAMPRYKADSLLKDIWHNVGTAGEPAFLNGFSNMSNPGVVPSDGLRFKKTVDDYVIIRGLIGFDALSGSSLGASIQVCQFPIGYKPLKYTELHIVSVNQAGNWGIKLSIDIVGNLYATCTSIPSGSTISNLSLDMDDLEPWELKFTTT